MMPKNKHGVFEDEACGAVKPSVVNTEKSYTITIKFKTFEADNGEAEYFRERLEEEARMLAERVDVIPESVVATLTADQE